MSFVNGRNPHKNAEGYEDPTAYEALMRVIKEEQSFDRFDPIEIAKKQRLYPPGTKIRIIEMHNDDLSFHNHKIGYVDFVDDLGYVFVSFKNGRGLRLSGLDEFEKIV